MLLGILIIIFTFLLFVLVVIWFLRTEKELYVLQSEKLDKLRKSLMNQYCDEWFPIIYDCDTPEYGRSLPVPFHVRRVLTIDKAKRTFELYTVMAEGDNLHKSVSFSESFIEEPADARDYSLGLNIKNVDFISPKILRSSEPIVENIRPKDSVAVSEFSAALARIIN